MGKKNQTGDISPELYVMGVGTSAGGIDALTKLLSGFNFSSHNLCVIIVQHLSPDHKSELASILSRHCKWPVLAAEDALKVEPHKIYVTPQNKSITFSKGLIQLEALPRKHTYAPSIDRFLTSLAESEKEYAIGMILSGTGQDGAKGIEAIKQHGGFTLAQSPQSAQYSDMPTAAIHTNCVDLVLHPAKVSEELNYYVKNHRLVRETAPRQKNIDIIFELLSRRCGVDFSQYKPSTIMRRIDKRIEALHLTDIKAYYEMIKNNPKELDTLFETVLIGVTEFFRDEDAFDLLRTQLGIYLKERRFTDTIRIWSVGCATGEEAYSIAILLYELMGKDVFKYQLQIFATDIDERALNIARKGMYSDKAVENLPAEILEKYFEKLEDGYEVKKTIKQHILFSRHDITNDPPFVKLDLVVCRNLLIYFNNYLQKEALKIFNYALRNNGILFLGKSESVSVTPELFNKMQGIKLFMKVQPPAPLNLRFSRYRVRHGGEESASLGTNVKNMSLVDIAKETLYYSSLNPFVIINEHGEIKESQGSLRLYIELNQGAINPNIFKMANKELVMEIKTLLAQVKRTSVPQVSRVIKFVVFDHDYFVRMKTMPLLFPLGDLQHFLLEFENVSAGENVLSVARQFSSNEFENYRIKELEQEIVALREHLQTFTQELESSNEEMQAVNEELQSSNEELKSSNEELETSNEELQSTNEELHTANNELRFANVLLIEKEEEIKRSKKESENNEILYRTISENIPNGTIGILNEMLQVEYIAGKGLDVYNIRQANLIGRYLPDMNPSEKEREKLVASFTKALNGEPNSIEYSYHDHVYMLQCIPFQFQKDDANKVLYLSQEITLRKRTEEKLLENEMKFRTLADNIPNLCWMANAEGWIYWYNSRWYEFTGTTPAEMEGWGWQSVHDPEILPEVMTRWTAAIKNGLPFEMVFPLKRADGLFRKFLTRIVPIKNEDNQVVQWFGTNTDITERENIAEQKDEFMSIASHELKTPVTSVKGFIQFSELLLEEGKFDMMKGILNKAHHQVDRLTSLINDLLDVSKLKAGRLDFTFSEFKIGEIMQNSIEELSGQAQHHTIKIEGDTGTIVYGDKMRLEQVINNLLTNAVKYSPDSSEIIIHVQQEATQVRVSVNDFGIGISSEKQPFLFDRFYRVEATSYKYQGMGMGLFICAEIVKRHGGIIGVNSEEGKGAEFFFTIPLQLKK